MGFIITLILVGLVLMFAEILLIPGVGVAGILGLISMGGSCFCAFHQYGNTVGAIVTAVNVVQLEEYLYGVVPCEMPASWHMEALKAQAVCARNFVLTRGSTHKSYGFDVCATTHCQVYGGVKRYAKRYFKMGG